MTGQICGSNCFDRRWGRKSCEHQQPSKFMFRTSYLQTILIELGNACLSGFGMSGRYEWRPGDPALSLCQDGTGTFGSIQPGEVFRLTNSKENKLNIMSSVTPDTSQAIQSLPIPKFESLWCVDYDMSDLASLAFAQAQVRLTVNKRVPVSFEGFTGFVATCKHR